MIKNWNQFIVEFVKNDGFINTKMSEIKDLIDNITDGSVLYKWVNNNDQELTVYFSNDDLSITYYFDIDDLFFTKLLNDQVDFSEKVHSVEAGLEIIENDIQSNLGIYEKGKIPKKYLTRKPKAMRKEIERFKGKKEYKKDWEADYDKRSGKRIKTKKSSSTKAYQKMFGKNENIKNKYEILDILYLLDSAIESLDKTNNEGGSYNLEYDYNDKSNYLLIDYNWSTYEEGGFETIKVYLSENPIRVEFEESQSTVYGDYDNKNTYKFNNLDELYLFIKSQYLSE